MPIAASSLIGPTPISVGAVGWKVYAGFDLNVLGSYTDPMEISTQSKANVQIEMETGAIGGWVGELQGSIDNQVWYTVSGKANLAVGIPNTTATVDTYRFIRVYTNTVSGAAATARVAIVAKLVV